MGLLQLQVLRVLRLTLFAEALVEAAADAQLRPQPLALLAEPGVLEEAEAEAVEPV